MTGPARTCGPTGLSRNSNSVTTPKFPPAPRTPQNRSLFSLGAGRDQLAVGGDQVHREQLVDRQAVLAHQPADAAAQGEPGQAGVGHDARRHGQPEGLRLPVELAEPHPRLGPHRPVGQVDPHALHQRQVDHQPVVAHRQAREAVAAAPDRHGEPDPAGEADGVDDVRHAGAAGDQRRVPVDRPVPHPPVLFVAGIARTDQLAAEGRAQLADRASVEAEAFPSMARHGRHGRSVNGGPARVRNLGSTRAPGRAERGRRSRSGRVRSRRSLPGEARAGPGPRLPESYRRRPPALAD